jgi:hypothetical protein
MDAECMSVDDLANESSFESNGGTGGSGWLRFLIGLVMLTVVFCFFASGYSPPGIWGEVLRHNQAEDIDASPLFYTEVENISDLEDGFKKMVEEAKSTRKER